MAFDLHQFCSEWLRSRTGNEPQKLLDFYTNDAFYSDPAVRRGLSGHDDLLLYFTRLLKHNPEWEWTIKKITPTEKGFTLQWEAAIPLKYRTDLLNGTDLVELRGGKISRHEVYVGKTAKQTT